MPETCQVDFYVLNSPNQTAEHLACRLALMAWEQGHQITVVTESDSAVGQLDALMWDYPSGRFLPHSTDASGRKAAVNIASFTNEIPSDSDVVINLSTSAIPEPLRFKRLLEIVPGKPTDREASRNKFRSYRELGLDPVSHTIGK